MPGQGRSWRASDTHFFKSIIQSRWPCVGSPKSEIRIPKQVRVLRSEGSVLGDFECNDAAVRLGNRNHVMDYGCGGTISGFGFRFRFGIRISDFGLPGCGGLRLSVCSRAASFCPVGVPNSLDLSALRLLMFALVRQIHVCATKNPVLQ